MRTSARRDHPGGKLKPIAFRPHEDVQRMFYRWLHQKGPHAKPAILINEALREHLAKHGYARKKDMQPN